MGKEFASADLTAGQLNAIVKKLGGYEGALRFLRGELEVKPAEHVIDCDVLPYELDGWKVVEYKRGGQLRYDPATISLYLSENQKNGKAIEGHKLRNELQDQPVLNANVLDYLLAHPELIPDSWKGKYIFFWGTVYRGRDGDLYVRCLCRVGDGWDWGYGWLGGVWDDDVPAAVLAI